MFKEVEFWRSLVYLIALRVDFVKMKHEENIRSTWKKEVTRASDP